MNGESSSGARKGSLYIERWPSYRVATIDRFHCTWWIYTLYTSAFQLRSHTEFHVGMECGLFEYFSMGWGNAQLHYIITACAAASFQ